MPVPGWDGEHEWTGDVPKDELPAEDNPARGYLLTANNKTTTPDYPHYLSYMASRFRADRLRELIEATETVGPADIQQMQADTTSIPARELARRFAAAPAGSEEARTLAPLLASWDGNLAADSPAGLVYDAVCEALSWRTVRPFLAQAKMIPETTAMDERRILYEQLSAESRLMLMGETNWDSAISVALEEAAAALVARFGADQTVWRWDAAHVTPWRHNLGRDAAYAHLNLPDVPVGGDASTPFATVADREGTVIHGVSYRQIFDLADLNAAQICVPPGNSGQPGSPHYGDNLERWRQVEYHPLYVEWDDIEANAEAHLKLVPAG